MFANFSQNSKYLTLILFSVFQKHIKILRKIKNAKKHFRCALHQASFCQNSNSNKKLFIVICLSKKNINYKIKHAFRRQKEFSIKSFSLYKIDTRIFKISNTLLVKPYLFFPE